MKKRDTCIYRNNVEQLKPCIIYRDNCEYYEREEDMKAIIQIDVPDYQIGQEVSIYFKDTMMIKGVVQEPSGDLISRQAVQDYIAEYLSQYLYNDVREAVEVIDEYIGELPSVNPQEPKTGHWKRNETIRLTYCSECGFGQHIDEFRTYNYCPNCGARMVEPQAENKTKYFYAGKVVTDIDNKFVYGVVKSKRNN